MTRLYEAPSRKLWIIGKLKSFLISDTLKRLSAQNELRDYSFMLSGTDIQLWNLHEKLEKIRYELKDRYKSYDYGNGYYYQSMKSNNISGYRNTEQRIEQLDLVSRLKGKKVLDIGSNTGFLLLSLANTITQGIGVELNHYLVETGKEVQDYMGVKNIEFHAVSFEEFDPEDKQFDIILSLANHSTYDGNTKQSIEDYFKKTADLLSPEGRLIFESHPPQIEPKEKLAETLAIIKKYFVIEETPQIEMEGFLDKNRTYVIAKKAE